MTMRIVESAFWSSAMLVVLLSFLSLLSPWYFSPQLVSSTPHISPWLRWNLNYTPEYTGMGLGHSGNDERLSVCRVTSMLAVLTSVALLLTLITDNYTQRSEDPHDAWLMCALLSAASTFILTTLCMSIWTDFRRLLPPLEIEGPFSFLIFHLVTALGATALCSKLYWDRKHSDLGCTCGMDHDCSHSHSHLGRIRSSSGHVVDLDHYASVIAQREYQEQNPDVIAMTELPQIQRIMEREEPNVGTAAGTDRTQMGRTDGNDGTPLEAARTQMGRTDGNASTTTATGQQHLGRSDATAGTTPATQQQTLARTDNNAGSATTTDQQSAGNNIGSADTTSVRDQAPTGRAGGNVQHVNRGGQSAGKPQGRRRTGNN